MLRSATADTQEPGNGIYERYFLKPIKKCEKEYLPVGNKPAERK